uniref:Uncharacterized protein n=1 Tax=Trichobilharzia regenti TaxID=157069 RepID=A0AA85K8X4_TRIRE|nr:unnamed protein product [Trichobilharzia regenti]
MLWYLHDKNIPISDLKCTYSLLVEFFSTFPSYASQLHKMNFIEGIQLDGATRTGLLCQFLCTMYARLSQYLFLDSSTICNAGGGGCGDVMSEQLTYSNVLSKLTNSIPGDRVSCSSSSSSTLNSITSSVLSAVGLVFQLTGGIPLTQREQTLLMSAVSKFLGEKVDRASLGYRLSRGLFIS